MASARVAISSSGASALLKSAGVRADIERRATAVRDKANSMASPDDMDKSPYGCSVREHSDRVAANVRTETPHGKNDNNKHNTLLKSIDAGRR